MERAVQRLFQKGFASYAANRRLPLHYHKAAYWLQNCRTARLGGHAQVCENGHVAGVWYNSCHNRYCPQCNGLIKARWLGRLKESLIQCEHRHLIFTIDHGLNDLWRCNRRVMADLLFQAVDETLKSFLGDNRYLGATPGYLLCLHTWSRSLALHPHIHCLITEGGLNSRGDWQRPPLDCFLPARAVMPKFRGKFLALIRRAVATERLALPADLTCQQLKNRLNKLGRKKWNVRIQTRYAHGAGVATYLARYLRGGPIHNSQLTVRDERIVYRYYSHVAGMSRLVEPVSRFLPRLLEHIPEPNRPTVRRYGLYAPSKHDDLNRARQQCGQCAVPDHPEDITVNDYLNKLGVIPRETCPTCGAPLYAAAPTPTAQPPPSRL